jgi:DNA-binding MarR family transcriptional regulator
MHRWADAHVARHRMSADQFLLLAQLADCDGVTQQELVRRVSSDPNTVRAMLLVLERRGLVERRRHPTDGRARSVTLTSKGRRTYERLWAEGQPSRDRLSALFTPDEAKTMVEFLARIADAMTQTEAIRRQLSAVSYEDADI